MNSKNNDKGSKGNKGKEINNSNIRSNVAQSIFCDVCFKSFASRTKLNEHLSSKSHKAKLDKTKLETKSNQEIKLNSDSSNVVVEEFTSNPIKKDTPKLTAENDILICFACNKQTSSLTDLLKHLDESHGFQFPAFDCLKNVKKAIKLIVKKVFKYGSCLYCDSQRFPNPKSVQTHMRDSGHVKLSLDDIFDHFYKFYDFEKIKQQENKTKYKLQIGYKVIKKRFKEDNAKNKKTEIKEEIEEVSDVDQNLVVSDEEIDNKSNTNVINSKNMKSENNQNNQNNQNSESDDELEDIEDINYVELQNGEALLPDGTILGNKMYKTAYKQRVKIDSEIKKSQAQHTNTLKLKLRANLRLKNRLKERKKMYSHWNVKGSLKGNFIRVNTLHIIRKQVNV